MARLYRCVLLWAAPALFIVVAPLYLQIHGERGAQNGAEVEYSSLLLAPCLILTSIAAASCAVDRCLACSSAFPLAVCIAQLMILLLLVNVPLHLGSGSAETAEPLAKSTPEQRLHGQFLEPTHDKDIPAVGGSVKSDSQVSTPPAAKIGIGKISVVLPCASEGEYTIKTVQSFCDRTPLDVLQEIIVVDDGSEPPLENILKAVDQRCRLRILRHQDTLGLMIAKQTGGDAALGEFIGFFDCHVAPNRGWHEELIKLLQASPRRLVVPTITDLSIDTWDEKENSAVNSKCYIDWNAEFMWFEDESDFIPVISGGLVATSRDWWFLSGGFDKQMRGWGGENIDQSLRAWLCGGDIVRAKSSRIAHMWRVTSDSRTRVRYKRVGGSDNTARVAAAWFDEFKVKFQHGRLKHATFDVSNIVERKEALKCKPYAYFLHRFRRVYQTGGVLPLEAFKLKTGDKCVRRYGAGWGVQACNDDSSIFHFGNRDPKKGGRCCSGIREWNTLECFDRLDPTGPLPYYCDVTGSNQNQQWWMREDGRIEHGNDGRCLGVAGGNSLVPSDCEAAPSFEQIDKFPPPETQMYRDAVKRYGYTDAIPDN